MKNEGSLRQTWLEAEYTINALEAQRSQLADKIKTAIANGSTQELPELRREMIALDTFELPLAQASAAEAAAKFYEAEADEFERQAEVAHARLDEVANRRNERMKQISEEYRDLQIDASGEFAQAQKVFLDAQHAVGNNKEQAQQYRARLAQAKQQQSAAL
jgi:hypothetical protein